MDEDDFWTRERDFGGVVPQSLLKMGESAHRVLTHMNSSDTEKGAARAILYLLKQVQEVRSAGGDGDFWDRLGEDGGGLPVHLPMGVTREGQGPTEPDPAHHYVCWCGEVECPLAMALQHAWLAGRRSAP